MITKREDIDRLTPAEKRVLLRRLLEERAARAQLFDLSPAQERLWFLEQVGEPTAVFTIARAFQIEGELNGAALRTAVSQLIDRHPPLRTTITVTDGRPQQKIHPPSSPLAQKAAKLHIAEPDQITLLAHQPFTLEEEPLVRFHLAPQAEQAHLLLIMVHHVLADEWSLDILYRELAQLYKAAVISVQPDPLPPYQAAPPHSDPLLPETEAYWQKLLAGWQPLSLPTDKPRPVQPTFRGDTYRFQLPTALTQAVRQLARQQLTTVYAVLTAVFTLFLRRLAGQNDVLFGVPLTQRTSAAAQAQIGYFVNLLPFRLQVADDGSFVSLLSEATRLLHGLQRHRAIPFEQLVAQHHPERSLSHNPFFQTALVLQSGKNGRLSLPSLQVQPVPLPRYTAKYDLTLFVEDRAHEWEATFEYCTELFDQETLARWADHFVTLLEGLVRQPQRPVQCAPLLSPAWRAQIVTEWNRTERLWEDGRLAHELVAAQTAVRPDQIAIAEANLTYGDLNRRANQLAHLLIAHGVRPESVVALLLPRSAELIIAQLAILKAGAAFLPIDPSYPSERIRFILQDALEKDGIVMVNDSSGAAAQLHQLPIVNRQSSIVNFSELDLSRFSVDPPSATVFPDSLAYLIYTSGSSGQPKGVQLTHRGLHNLIQWHIHEFKLTHADRTTHLANVAFDAAVWEIWPTLAAGATLHLPDDDTRHSPWLLQDYLLQHEISVSFVPTPLAETMLTLDWPLSTPLRLLLTGGDRLRQQPPSTLPFTLVNNYGPTEATVVATAHPFTVHDSESTAHHSSFPPIGRSLPNVTTYILDPHLNPVPSGVIGELYIGGAGLARAYHNQPALTAEKFVPNPFVISDAPAVDVMASRLYRTGDWVRHLADGTLEFVGRRDSQIKIRGHRLELGEIEAALKAITAVSQAVVLHHDNQLHAFLITDQTLNQPKLKQALAERLPRYMLPHSITLMAKLPLTPHGKIDRTALLAHRDKTAAQPVEALPANPTEETLMAIWAELLNQPQIGRFDNFFALGGDSILAIQIVARARAAELDLQPHHLFQHPTVAELAQIVQPLSPAQPVVASEPLSSVVPLSPIQHWFFAQQFAVPHHWNMPILLHVPASTNLAHLQTAVNHLITHHTALRLRFRPAADGIEQFYAELEPVEIERLLLPPRHAPEAAAVEAAHLRAANASLDLEAGPLVRLLHLRHADSQNGRLLFIVHHLLIDGVSWRILLQDLTLLYQQLTNGQPPQLPAASSSFQAWTSYLAETAVVQANPSFWLEEKGSIVNRQLSIVNSKQSTFGVTQISLASPPTVEQLLMALADALAQQTIGENITVALEGHGREHLHDQLDLSRTVGWFTSLFPFPLPLQGTLDEKLETIRARRAALPHSGLDFGWAQTYGDVATQQRLAALPQPQISFNYLGQYDQFLPADAPFKLLDSLPPHARAAANQRPFPLQINAYWQNDRLHLTLAHQHDQAAIQQLATDFTTALTSLLAKPANRRIPNTQNQSRPLAPAQQMMLQHTLANPNSEAYRLQWSYRIDGDIYLDAFRKAWLQTLARYDTFRTKIGSGYTVEQAEDWTMLDWRTLAPEAQESSLHAFLQADRQTSFDLYAPPLRFALIRLSDTATQFVWTIHHALIDGWSLAPVWRELLKRYAALQNGRSITLSPSTPFRSYLDWRTAQDWTASRAYWQSTLHNAPFPISAEHRTPNTEHQLALPAEQTALLIGAAKQHRLTLNTVILGAWLRAWGNAIQQDEFLFGITSTGRPATLPDVDNIVGPFINTLPLRVQLDETPLPEWLPTLQQQLVTLRQHDTAAPSQIRDWLALPTQQPLFEGFFRFQNYPAKRLLEQHQGDFQIHETSIFDRWHYPLSVVAVPGEQLLLKLAWNNGRFPTATIHAALNTFQTLLQNASPP